MTTKHGGKREGSGRKKGIPNKATADIKALAQDWGPGAVRKLAELAGLVKDKPGAQSETARITALGMILDRAYGKPPQIIGGDGHNPLRIAGPVRTIDAPPAETREQWLERRAKELGVPAHGAPLATRLAS
jgi:hypothetical protein